MPDSDQPTTAARLLHARTQLAGCQRHCYLGGIDYWSKRVAELEQVYEQEETTNDQPRT
jgi:hypothetical protein